MRRWWRKARVGLRRRVWRLVGVLVLLVVATLLLVAARLTQGFNSDLLLNLGAAVVMVALSYAVLDPLFEEVRRARVEERPSFDGQEFRAHVATASHLVAVMDTANHMLEGPGREPFLRAVRSALGNGATVRVLLLDPDSAAATRRAEEIRPVDVRRVIQNNLRHLHDFASSLPPGQREQFQVRIYDASPSIHLFRWDDKALVSFFPIGMRASASPHLEVYLESPLGEFVQGRFDELWRHPSTRPLHEYVVVPVTVFHGESPLRSCGVHFVHVDGAWFIDGTPMVDQLTDHGSGRLDIVTGRPLGADGGAGGGAGGGQKFRLARVDGDAVPDREAVLRMFDAKYGPRQLDGPGRARLAMRLVPRRDEYGLT